MLHNTPAVRSNSRGLFTNQTPRTAWTTGLAAVALFTIALLLLTGVVGCSDRVALLPNSDPALRKGRSEFANDAINRQPYHADAPRGGRANGRASYDYWENTIQVANFADEDWTDVELWVNGQYVVFLPKVEGQAKTAKTINFEMLYNAMGQAFPNENKDEGGMIKKIEVFRDGKMYELTALPAD